jgi:ABC-2 type transport system permease protein
MAAVAAPVPAARRAWPVVLQQELRDLWLGGRGLALGFAYSVLLSVIAYLVATNRALNFLEHRETVNLTLQVGIAVGALLALLAAADAFSGERERGTLESLLLTPASRLEITAGKLAAALSLASLLLLPGPTGLLPTPRLELLGALAGFLAGWATGRLRLRPPRSGPGFC